MGRDITPRVHAFERWSPGGAGGGSRCGAAAQVGHALQAQTLGDVAETLTRGGEAVARETRLAQRRPRAGVRSMLHVLVSPACPSESFRRSRRLLLALRRFEHPCYWAFMLVGDPW